MEREPWGGEGLPSRGRGLRTLQEERRAFLQCSQTKTPDRALGRALFRWVSFSTAHLLPQTQEATGPQPVIRSSSPCGPLSPSPSPRRLAGRARGLQILPDPPSSCYLGGTIIFLCREARCQESPEQGGEAEQWSDPLSAWRGQSRPGEALPSLAWGPILQWRVPLSGRGRGAGLGGKKPRPRNDSGAPSKVCGWPVHSFLLRVSHLSRAVFACFPENSGRENYQVDHLLSFWFLDTPAETFPQPQADATQQQTDKHRNIKTTFEHFLLKSRTHSSASSVGF